MISGCQIEDVEFIPSSVTTSSTTLTKDQIRELERQKAQEAELRKKRRMEANDKKRVKAVELSKKQEEEEKEKERQGPKAKQVLQQQQPRHQGKASSPEDTPVATAEDTTATVGTEEVEVQASAPQKTTAASTGPTYVPPALKPVAAAKRPAAKYGPMKRAARFVAANQVLFVVLAFLLLMIALFAFASF